MKNTSAAAIAVACLAGGVLFGHYVGHAPISQCKAALEQADNLTKLHDESLYALMPVIGSRNILTVEDALNKMEVIDGRTKATTAKYNETKGLCW